MSSLDLDFKNHVDAAFPELKEGTSVLALSGGVDSMVLCHLLLKAGINFVTAHCNFMLRGNESEEDEGFVLRISEELGLQAHVKRFDTTKYARDSRVSLQMAARELRYAWFDEILGQTGARFILTAHHADDNLETFFINLSRGSGIKGLTGIPVRAGRIRRPLLPFSREQILGYALENKIQWREDLSNNEDKYLRNRIRRELIPLLKQTFPSFLPNFKKTLRNLEETKAIADDRLEEVWREATLTKGASVQIDIDRIRSTGNTRAYLYGLLSKYGFSQWDDMEELLSAQPGKMILSGSHRLVKDREHLLLQNIDMLPNLESLYAISRGQELLELSDGQLLLREFPSTRAGSEIESSCQGKGVACFDADLLDFPLCVRKWQKGDYFYPRGMDGSKKVSKFFKDAKLSIPEKENIWLLCSGKDVLWIVGMRSDERFKVSHDTTNILRIEHKSR